MHKNPKSIAGFNPYRAHTRDHTYASRNYDSRKVLAFQPRKKNFRKVFFLKFLLFLFLFFSSAILLGFFLRSSVFYLRKIEIHGLNHLSYEEVKQASGIKLGGSIWENSLQEIHSNIDKLAKVNETKVKRHLPGMLEIIIIERETAALIPYRGMYLKLCAEGTFFDSSPKPYRGVPIITGVNLTLSKLGDTIGDLNQLEVFRMFFSALEENPTLVLSEINIADPSDIVIFTTDGLKVRFGSVEDASSKINMLIQTIPHIKEGGGGHLDLRARNPVFKPD